MKSAAQKYHRAKGFRVVFPLSTQLLSSPALQELPGIFVQLHALLAQHSSVWGRILPVEEALLCDVLSEVIAPCAPPFGVFFSASIALRVGPRTACRAGPLLRLPVRVYHMVFTASASSCAPLMGGCVSHPSSRLWCPVPPFCKEARSLRRPLRRANLSS